MSRFEQKIADGIVNLESRQLGAEFWVSTTVVLGMVPSQPHNITLKASGDAVIEDVILRTDATGLADIGSLVIDMEGTKGTQTIMVVGLGDLGASATIDLAAARLKEEDGFDSSGFNAYGKASVIRANGKRILEANKRIRVRNVGAATTGLGKVDIYLKFRKLSVGSDVVAA